MGSGGPGERESGEFERWLDGLRAGEEAAVREFCARYGEQLERVAARHIAPGLRRRVGPESVVQSACVSFLRRARRGDYRLDDGEDLWRLLCAITLRKVREQARFHMRQRRGLDRERDGAAGGERPAPAPPPDEALAIAEELERLLGGLDEDERRLVDWKLQGLTNAEVAERMGCTERTVRRSMASLRERLEPLARGG